MLIRQPVTINNRDFIKTFAFSLKSEYSDWTVEDVLDKLKDGIDIEYAIENHYYIVNQNNQKYSEAYDPIEFKDDRIYTETDEKIDIEPTPEPEPVDPERINRLEQTVEQQSDDIEANAEAIQELAEIVGGE